MKVARLFGLVILVVLAASAMAASSASAIYTFKLPITNRNFTALSLTSVLNNGTQAVTCTHDVGSGVILNDDEVLAKVHFLNCTVTNSSGTCPISSINQGVTQQAGLVLTELLRGLLGLLSSPNNGAGILFAPNVNKEPNFVTFAAVGSPCNIPESQAEGNIAGLFSPTGKLQTAGKILFNSPAAGKNEISTITTLAGLVTVKIKSFGIAAGFSSEENVQFEEAVEVV